MMQVGEEVVTHQPLLSFEAHNDVVNGIRYYITVNDECSVLELVFYQALPRIKALLL